MSYSLLAIDFPSGINEFQFCLKQNVVNLMQIGHYMMHVKLIYLHDIAIVFVLRRIHLRGLAASYALRI